MGRRRGRPASVGTISLWAVAAAIAALVSSPTVHGACPDAACSASAQTLHADPARASNRLSHSRVLPYPLDQVWPTALRYLRVDRGYTLVDRDAEAGYILFDFPTEAASDAMGEEIRVGRGSLELLATVDPSGRPSVKLQVSADAGPSHLPYSIAEGLAAKLKAERGQPAPPPPSSPTPPSPPPQDPDVIGPAVDPSELSTTR